MTKSLIEQELENKLMKFEMDKVKIAIQKAINELEKKIVCPHCGLCLYCKCKITEGIGFIESSDFYKIFGIEKK